MMNEKHVCLEAINIMALASKAFPPSREYQRVMTREEGHFWGFHTGESLRTTRTEDPGTWPFLYQGPSGHLVKPTDPVLE